MAVKRNYRINLRNYGNPPAVMVSQYDENYDLVFEVYDGVVPATGLNAYTVKLVGRQPGNDPALKYEFTGTVSGIANNILSFTIDTTMTGRAGKGTAEIVILDTTNDVKFASFNLPVYVEKAAVPDDAIDADVERAQEIADEVQEIVENAAAEVKGEAESWAVGERDGVPVPSTDPTYQNNAKYYSEQAAQIAEEISGVTGQVAQNTSDISGLKEDLNNLYFSPSTALGYWTENGTIAGQSPTQKEVYTEWLVPSGTTFSYKLTYPQTYATWICVMYEFSGGSKQRVLIKIASGTSFEGIVTIPSDVIRMSLSYRTYGDCTFAICGVFKELTEAEKQKLNDAITAEDVAKYNYKYPLMDGLELVEVINTSASDRNNWSNSTLNGLYLLVPEFASDGYSFQYAFNPNTNRFVFNLASNVAYISNAKINARLAPSASAGHKLYIYKIGEGEALSLIASALDKIYPFTFAVNSYHQYMRTTSFDNTPFSWKRVSSDVFNYYGKFKLNLADTTTYKVAIQSFSRETRTMLYDSGWVSDGYEFPIPTGCCFVVVVAKNDNTNVYVDDVPNDLVTVEAVEMIGRTPVSNEDINLLNTKIDAIPVAEMSGLISAVDSAIIQTLMHLRNVSPVYDHLFVNDEANPIIPHESPYHLRLSKALGYKIIEANTRATSDGVIVVNHFNNGKFGSYFHHVDGVTDISNIDVNTVTWAWIVENVRYNSAIPKYRTRPSRLEEFLEECNRQNMIPFVSASASGAIAMADKYMGHYNYICYGGTRESCPYGIIFAWNTSNTTKEQILATCDAIGSPMIYGLGNPQSFTDAELLEIVEALHAKGYAVGTSYQNTNWAKYRAIGFDFNGSQTMINRIEDGNICNYSTIFGWDDFNITGSPTNNDNVLTFANSGTIAPKLSADTYPVSGYDLEIVFDGQIDVVNGYGGTKTFTSDGSSPVFCAYPVLNGSPNVTINVSANTVIYDLYFKAKRFY